MRDKPEQKSQPARVLFYRQGSCRASGWSHESERYPSQSSRCCTARLYLQTQGEKRFSKQCFWWETDVKSVLLSSAWLADEMQFLLVGIFSFIFYDPFDLFSSLFLCQRQNWFLSPEHLILCFTLDKSSERWEITDRGGFQNHGFPGLWILLYRVCRCRETDTTSHLLYSPLCKPEKT